MNACHIIAGIWEWLIELWRILTDNYDYVIAGVEG